MTVWFKIVEPSRNSSRSSGIVDSLPQHTVNKYYGRSSHSPSIEIIYIFHSFLVFLTTPPLSSDPILLIGWKKLQSRGNILLSGWGFWYAIGATPAVESPSLQLKVFKFLKGATIEVALSSLEPLTLLRISFTVIVLRFFRKHFFYLIKNWI